MWFESKQILAMAMNDNQDNLSVVKAISLLLTCEEYQPSECREEKCGDKCLGRGRVLGRGE